MSLDYTIYNRLIAQEKERGRTDALSLRSRAKDMDGTAVISEERKAPVFDPQKDYSSWEIGSPVRELVDGEYQVFKLLQPYNAANYEGTPSTLPAIWSICHTTDPMLAKPYLAPNGTSGMYMTGDCCTENGTVYKSIIDNNVWAPSSYPTGWEVVNLDEVV